MKTVLFAALALAGAWFLSVWASAITGELRRNLPRWRSSGVGFVTNVFDTLGIGSFATTSAFFKLWGMVEDDQIPGTLMVGHTPPSLLQAYIFIAVVAVDPATLMLMIASSAAGSWLGAGIVSRLPRDKIRTGMGTALLGAAVLMTMNQLHWIPGGGEGVGLSGAALALAVVGNMILGALMTLGIGLYAPCMILVSLLGMSPRAAFPIMTGSCAALMSVGSIPFIRSGRYSLKAALGLTAGGIPGVLLAAFVVKSLPLAAVRWLVVAVVIYTGSMMLRSAVIERRTGLASVAAQA
ncbi:MAG TPA: sulfite exporter TauE/SafE family protein [Bryobacteraceae bacterium]|nr:sulfite exporter TauE/SafE family protein [Bryobacteraceae bacterium]HUI56186.1 sulfite exporter TauE/SafE family protein [Bryobacteraceae bacterium]